MKKVISLFLIMCCLISMTACSKDKIVEQYNQALQAVGDNGLTNNNELQGKRNLGADSYVGTYEADYENFSGKETLFGGTALEREPEVLCDTENSYSATLELPSASNYIIVEAENFTGSLDLTIE